MFVLGNEVLQLAAELVVPHPAIAVLAADRCTGNQGVFGCRLETPADEARVQPRIAARSERAAGAAELQRCRQAKREVLGPLDLIAVAQLLEPVLDQFVAHVRSDQLVAGRHLRRRHQAGLGRIGVVLPADADRVALNPTIDAAGRPAAEGVGQVLPMAVLAHDLAGVVDRVDSVVFRCRNAAGPRRVQGIERVRHRRRLARPVAVLRLAVAQ